MLENSNGNFDLRFKIKFGNLKKEFKDNYYLATKERYVENSIIECKLLCEKDKSKYVTAIINVLGNEIKEQINLNYFEEWEIESIV
jgi:hypothetical protein